MRCLRDGSRRPDFTILRCFAMSSSNQSNREQGKLDVLSLQDLEYVSGGAKKGGGGGGNSAISLSCLACKSTVSNNCGGKAAMFVDLYEL